MKISLSTNYSAGFSRIKLFACILAVLILGDLLFRSGSGFKSILQLKDKAAPTAATNHITKIMSNQRYPLEEPTNPPAIVPPTNSTPVVTEKKVAPRVGDGGQAGDLLKGTADTKNVKPVNFGRKRMTNPPPESVPLPIALPK